jgi:hypothetical protein
MDHTNRRALILAILLGALTVLVLSACGVSDTQGGAPTAAPTALDVTAGTAATSDVTTDPAATARPSGDATATPTADADEPTATTDPVATPEPKTDPAATPTATDDTDPFTGTDDLTDTDDLTNTTTLTVSHPVAIAIADYFGVPAPEVFAQHQEGLGFGEIARAYFLARELAADGDPTNDLTADQILAMHQGGQGWGQIVRSLGLPQSNRDRNLGLIMSWRGHKPGQGGATTTDGSATTATDTSPGKSKQDDTSHGDKGHGNGGGKGKKSK